MPGEISSYSNYGIALAAYVIESIAEVDFAKFCMERIFLPLEMNYTTYEYIHDVTYVSKAYLPDGNEAIDTYGTGKREIIKYIMTKREKHNIFIHVLRCIRKMIKVFSYPLIPMYLKMK